MIVFNWKMNPTSLNQALELAQVSDKKNVVLCPPFVFLSKIKLKKAWLGAQDCFWQNQGAFTGQTSPLMLKKMGCSYVIIGHSERRRLFQETDQMINQKIKACLLLKMKPIICVGSEKKGQSARKEIEKQLEKSLDKQAQNIVVAYEPVSAISTNKGIIPTVQEIKQAQNIIKTKLVDIFGVEKARKVKIIYGGSVDSENIKRFTDQTGMDGFLIGAASLKVKEIKKILS